MTNETVSRAILFGLGSWLAFILTACAPTQQDIETAVAATMAPQQTIAAAVVQTQAAIVTPTPVPPTTTPTPVASPTATEDPCPEAAVRSFYGNMRDIVNDWSQTFEGIAVDDSGFRALVRLELTQHRDDFVALAYPECAVPFRLSLIAAMDESIELTDTLIEHGDASQAEYDSMTEKWEDALSALKTFYDEHID